MSSIQRTPRRPKEELAAKRFARLNNNFVRQNEGFGEVIRHGVTAFQLWGVLAYLAEAQRRDRRRLVFRTDEEALEALNLGGRKRERELLHTLLRTWQRRSFVFENWYRTSGKKKKPPPKRDYDDLDVEDVAFTEKVSEERAREMLETDYQKKVAAHEQENSNNRPLHIPAAWRYRRHLPGHPDGELVVQFDAAFFKANRSKRYFVPAHLTPLRVLGSPQRMALALLVRSQPDWTLTWRPATVARKIGLNYRAPDQQMIWLKTAMMTIGEAYGLVAGCERSPAGQSVVLTLRQPTRDQADTEREARLAEHVHTLEEVADRWHGMPPEQRKSRWRGLKGLERQIVQAYWERKRKKHHRYMPTVRRRAAENR